MYARLAETVTVSALNRQETRGGATGCQARRLDFDWKGVQSEETRQFSPGGGSCGSR